MMPGLRSAKKVLLAREIRTKKGGKKIECDAHQMHAFVLSLLQKGVYPARITALTRRAPAVHNNKDRG